MRWLRRAAVLAGLSLALSACVDFAPERPVARTRIPVVPLPTPERDSAPRPEDIPPDIANTPDAVPKDEPPSKSGNPDSYEALGETYVVMKENGKGYFETGRASWYGNKFHGRKTASGELYNMFAMTGAHKTLRLPSYARITNLDNGRSCIVKINDRGPFVKGRIVDVSYAAAVKLDMLKTGHANVTLELMTRTDGGKDLVVASDGPRYLQAGGAFDDPIDAVGMQAQLESLGLPASELLQVPNSSGDAPQHILRIGPFESFAALETARLKLQRKGISAVPSVD